MKRWAALLAAAAMLVCTGVADAAPGAKPQRVMSLNMCTDQLLLQLLGPFGELSFVGECAVELSLKASDPVLVGCLGFRVSEERVPDRQCDRLNVAARCGEPLIPCQVLEWRSGAWVQLDRNQLE